MKVKGDIIIINNEEYIIGDRVYVIGYDMDCLPVVSECRIVIWDEESNYFETETMRCPIRLSRGDGKAIIDARDRFYVASPENYLKLWAECRVDRSCIGVQ